MLDIQLYLAFVLATSILMLIPGPNVALIVANSVAYGARFGLLTVAGTSSAMVAQLAVTALGMTAVLETLAYWFEWIRWLGVAYLLYLGISQWRAPAVDLTRTKPQPKSVREIFLRGFLVSLSNPKTLLFYGAFFPQFISTDAPLEGQIALLSLTFLVLAVLLDGGWALLAARARGFLATRGRFRNRLSGSLLIAAGLGLALARRR
ncbi:MAG TPA: LysE family translocator [Stellaceae bacterium]|nr:LysE family translocator [Stellaceae bacterium]